MKTILTSGCLLAGLVSATLLAAADDAKKPGDLEKLAGSWTVTELTYNGEDHNPKNGLQFVFKGDEVSLKGSAELEKDYGKLKFKLDPATSPKLLDITVTAGGQLNVTFEGIYELKEDEFRFCVRVVGKDRPTEFKAPGESNLALLTLKRDKK